MTLNETSRGTGLGSLLSGDVPEPEAGEPNPEVEREAEEARKAEAARKAERDRKAEVEREAEEARKAEAARKAERDRRAAERQAEEAKKTEDRDGKPAQVTVYVSPELKKRHEAYKHKERISTRDVVLRALATQKEKLQEIIAESKYYLGEVNELFPPDERKARYLGGGSDAQVQFNPTVGEEAVLQRFESELGFVKRSTWLAPVLNAFLPGKKETLKDANRK